MTDNVTQVHIGNLASMGMRFAEAWKAIERGDPVATDHVTFLNLEGFMSAMSPRRLELLRHLRRRGAMSVRQLGQELDRDYKSVHREVVLLANAGLIERIAKDRVAVTWDRVVTELDLAA